MSPTLFALAVLHRLRLAATADPERGDVPGWVMITVMTAGVAVALFAIAAPALRDMLQNALDSIRSPL